MYKSLNKFLLGLFLWNGTVLNSSFFLYVMKRFSSAWNIKNNSRCDSCVCKYEGHTFFGYSFPPLSIFIFTLWSPSRYGKEEDDKKHEPVVVIWDKNWSNVFKWFFSLKENQNVMQLYLWFFIQRNWYNLFSSKCLKVLYITGYYVAGTIFRPQHSSHFSTVPVIHTVALSSRSFYPGMFGIYSKYFFIFLLL